MYVEASGCWQQRGMHDLSLTVVVLWDPWVDLVALRSKPPLAAVWNVGELVMELAAAGGARLVFDY